MTQRNFPVCYFSCVTLKTTTELLTRFSSEIIPTLSHRVIAQQRFVPSKHVFHMSAVLEACFSRDVYKQFQRPDTETNDRERVSALSFEIIKYCRFELFSRILLFTNYHAPSVNIYHPAVPHPSTKKQGVGIIDTVTAALHNDLTSCQHQLVYIHRWYDSIMCLQIHI